MGQPEHPESGRLEPVEIGEVAVEGVGALDREEARDEPRIRRAADHERVEVGRGSHDRQLPVGCFREARQATGQMLRPGR